jgi:uncharacterized protein (DUF3084 family)
MKSLVAFLTKFYRLNEREAAVIERGENLRRIATDLELQRLQLSEEWNRLEKAHKVLDNHSEILDEREATLDLFHARITALLDGGGDPGDESDHDKAPWSAENLERMFGQ